MEKRYHKNILPFAKELRHNMTKEERRLWYDFLQPHPAKFYRQRIIGPYIADFYCANAHLVIELDGSQHYEPVGIEYDAIRTDYLAALDIRVLRFSNLDINQNFSGVCQSIDLALRKSQR